MAGNHLEDLVAEWYRWQGYVVRRNIRVGPRSRGGHECELDIVAFHPVLQKLVHVEPSLDADKWEKKEQRYSKKFKAGVRYIRPLFEGFTLPFEIEQIALFAYGGASQTTIAGGHVLLVKEFMRTLLEKIRNLPLNSRAIPEEYPLLRTLQFAAQYWPIGAVPPTEVQTLP